MRARMCSDIHRNSGTFSYASQAMDMMPGHKGVRGFVLARWLKQDGPEQEQERLQKTLQLIADGTIAPTGEHVSSPLVPDLSPSYSLFH